MTKIYTKTGDDGQTSLFRGGRVLKSHIRIEAYGTVDELNSVIACAVSKISSDRIKEALTEIQNQLFIAGSDLASPPDAKKNSDGTMRLGQKHIDYLESLIDEFDSQLPELKNFILPGGTEGSAFLHLSRTVCRRAERRVVELSKSEEIGKFLVIYINRLSDLLFVLSRYENHVNNKPDVIWLIGKKT